MRFNQCSKRHQLCHCCRYRNNQRQVRRMPQVIVRVVVIIITIFCIRAHLVRRCPNRSKSIVNKSIFFLFIRFITIATITKTSITKLNNTIIYKIFSFSASSYNNRNNNSNIQLNIRRPISTSAHNNSAKPNSILARIGISIDSAEHVFNATSRASGRSAVPAIFG